MSLENFFRYGLLFDPVKIISVFLKDPYKWPAVYLIAASVLFALPAVFIERYLRKVRGSESVGLVLQSVNLFLLVTFPAVMVYRMQAITPAGGLLTMFVYTIIALKLFSYYQVNRWYREGTPRPVRGTSRMQDPSAHQSRRNERGQSKQIMYPMNLKVKDLYYFLLAPTLCYQLNFPRQKNCRQGYIIRRFIEMIFLFHLMLGLIQQWIVPNIHKSMKPINEIESTLLTEYILKLAYLIAIPLKMFRFWMFFAMAAQVPLACLMKRLFGDNFGNIFMWTSLVLGPPLMMLLYFHDYYIQHHRKDSSWRLFFF
uniref:diacylglycerol O-acyltransferase n=1 Tax=Gopherus agassizii TaxID=38772 RepID=A0A452HY26_9SAUR